jgi:DsbC/DsbD-like thiol-disulfide interchange protein
MTRQRKIAIARWRRDDDIRPMRLLVPFLSWLAAGLAVLPAAAAGSDWFHAAGGSMRIVTADAPDADGRLAGALEIRLDPGWKTYWMDPGDSGVPPQIDLAASRDVRSVRILYPPPKRLGEDDARWAGYDGDVALVLEFETGAAPRIAADVFVGICETICVPVQARLEVFPDGHADPEAEHVIARARNALPRAAEPGFAVEAIEATGESSLRARVAVPSGDGGHDLFLAGRDGWQFGIPVARDGPDGGLFFDIPVIARPAGDKPVEIDYTLVSGGRSVAGIVRVAP